MLMDHGLVFRLAVLVRSLSLAQATPQFRNANQTSSADFGKSDHAVMAHQSSTVSESQATYQARHSLEQCHVLARDKQHFINTIPAPNNDSSSFRTSATPLLNVENQNLSKRTPDPSLICVQIASFHFAISGSFASTQPLRLFPNRTYIFSIDSSAIIRSIICWRNRNIFVAQEGPIFSTRATLDFTLEEPSDVHFTIIWNLLGRFNISPGFSIPPLEPDPVGEVGLFSVPRFAED